jgi:hypothetical protein
LFTVAAAGDASRGAWLSHNAVAMGTKQMDLGTVVDIKIAILTGLIGVIAFFGHRNPPAPTPGDREPI